MRRPGLWLVVRVRKGSIFGWCQPLNHLVEEKEMWLASPLLERRLTEPVRHLCDGARGCGCVVVSNDSGSARSVMSRTTLQDRTVKGHVGSTLTKPGAEA